MKDGRLERIEAKISSDDAVKMVPFHSMIAQKAQLVREFVAAANRHTGITRSAKILCWKKAEERGVAKRSRAPRAASRGIFRSDGLGSIFDDRHVIRHNRLAECVHRAAGSKKMNGYHRANAVAARGEQLAIGTARKMPQAVLQSFGIHVKGVGPDVHKNRLSADSVNAARSRKKRVRRRDDGVAGTDSHRHENRKLSIGA